MPADQSDDLAHRERMAARLRHAAHLCGVTLHGTPVFGWHERTIGCQVTTEHGPRWLRVVSEMAHWIGEFWTGNQDANALTGVLRPQVLHVEEWAEGGDRCRAEVMTLAHGRPVSPTMALDRAAPVDEAWWHTLRRSLDAVAASHTSRVCLDAATLVERVGAFGVTVDLASLAWTTAHGDLHWGNLTTPDCWLLDWEAWGAAPAGYDAASLLCASLPHPPTADTVRSVFADLLDTPTGTIAQLAAAARFLTFAEAGEYPDLTPLLHTHTRQLLASTGHGDQR
jgi:hypothetical protein